MRVSHTAPHGESWRISCAPDPGFYHKESSLLWSHASLSKRGYGMVVSDSKKGLVTPRNEGPGPGTYDTKPGHRGAIVSPFALTTAKPKLDTCPGPGTYDLADGEGERSQCGAVAAFRSSSRKSHPVLWSDVHRSPGVGTYDEAPDMHHVTTMPFSWGSTSSSTSTGMSARSTNYMDLQRLPVSISDADKRLIRHKSNSLPRQHQCGPSASKRACKEQFAHQKAFSSTRMALQHIPTEQDRFGRPVQMRVHQAQLPGPGTYSLPSSLRQTHAARKRAPFDVCARRTSLLTDPGLHEAPGPAFYSLPERKRSDSHHTVLPRPGLFLA
ncbi:hypothetical protein WJX74_001475 [Apatococcus lobatus]|uniref:Uncharacterized protein n=1 Tax=Apatococcus lobatus TaxID=904363 RepID=A0AAW1S5H2_9CHLO